MNLKPYLCAFCVLATPAALTAAGPDLAPPQTNAAPAATAGLESAGVERASTKAAPAKKTTAAREATHSTQKGASAVKSASTTRATAQPAPTHLHDPVLKGPAYIHGQASPYGYDSAYAYDPSCADGGCYDGFYGGWSCYPQLKHWGSVEYLLWWRKGMRIPPLVSTGPVPPNAVLFGGRNLDFGPQSGGRATFGAWLDDYECIGLGARFFGLSDGRVDFRQTAAGPGTLARPFIDADTGAPNAVDVGGALGGGLDIALESEVFAAEALFRRRIECGFCGRLDLLGGYTYTQINEEIGIRTFTTLPPGPPNALNVFDVFDADNEFHGGTVGLQAEFDRGRFTVGMLSKISFGTMHETVTILGGNNNPAAAPGLQGLLAQNTNIGEFEQDEFAVVPEVNLTLGFRATEHVELVAGYSMVYWSHVVQPGDHIDLTVDLTPTAATTRPAFNFDSTDYWVMGMNFGMQWSY